MFYRTIKTNIMAKAVKKSAKKGVKKQAAKKVAKKKASAKRKLIAPRGDKRYVRRNSAGQFKESDDQGKSLGQDRKRKAKRKAKPGQGDKGDR